MATPALISFAKRANVSIEMAETRWEEAKHEVDNNLRRTDPKQYWARVMWLVQKKLGLKESISFKEFAGVDLAFSTGELDHEAHEQPAEPTGDPTQADPMIELSSHLAGFVSRLFGARDMAHSFHLSTNSFAQHEALKELYELLLGHADKWAEVGQGITGFPFGFCTSDRSNWPGDDPVAFIRSFIDELATCDAFVNNQVLSNMMQDLQAAVYRVKYKLEQLK